MTAHRSKHQGDGRKPVPFGLSAYPLQSLTALFVFVASIVIILRQGRIAETGTRDELIASGGYYAGLYAAQWRGEIATD